MIPTNNQVRGALIKLIRIKRGLCGAVTKRQIQKKNKNKNIDDLKGKKWRM